MHNVEKWSNVLSKSCGVIFKVRIPTIYMKGLTKEEISLTFSSNAQK